MLREIPRVRQIPGESHRRWFTDEQMDLFVWSGENESFSGYQLSYDKTIDEKAITYKPNNGYLHNAIDDGTRPGQYPSSPMLVADGFFDAERVRVEFLRRATDLDERVVRFVDLSLHNYTNASELDVMQQASGVRAGERHWLSSKWFYLTLVLSMLALLGWMLSG